MRRKHTTSAQEQTQHWAGRCRAGHNSHQLKLQHMAADMDSKQKRKHNTERLNMELQLAHKLQDRLQATEPQLTVAV